MLPEWLKSIFRGTRKEIKEAAIENADAVANTVTAVAKTAIAAEAAIIKNAAPVASSIVDTVEKAAGEAVEKVAKKAAKNVKKAASKKRPSADDSCI